ncbi:MAG TPA: amino acid ABC transporter permease [Acidimicrobiia bacterium]|jgi:general L-amino acid transport system permease protein|nr:amino acid ABC transporter permease [Acidimicrobiia bacterium]
MTDPQFPMTQTELGAEEPIAIPVAESGPRQKLPPGKWLRRNLFNNWYNSLLTIVIGALLLFVAVRAFSFVFITGRWEPVRANLTLFQIGTFPRDEEWRVVAQVLIWTAALGLGVGAAVAGAKFRALQAGVEYVTDPALDRLKRYWALVLLLLVWLFFADTIGPLLLTVASLALAWGGYAAASRVSGPNVGLLWSVVGVLGVLGFQIVSGFFGLGWLWMGLPIAVAVYALLGRPDTDDVKRQRRIQLIGVLVTFAVLFGVYTAVDSVGVEWDDWEGLQLNLLAAAIAIALSFPLGLLLALARRSSFPALRVMATTYIEIIRGVPLISLLLMAQFFIGFFLNTDTPLSLFTRAIAAMTLFTAAYVAEIVRGGLQAVPKGQMEAGNSIGLPAWKVTQLIVLPQALRAVIPAMVGQFISLFKDTSLLLIIGKLELLGVREIVHGQPDFRGFGIAESLVYVAFVFWAISFTMSRESQRLERKLGVGER